MIDLNKIIEYFSCDDCGLTFSDCQELLDHRKYHTGLFRSGITEETPLEERCPLCLVKHRGKYKNKCLEEPLHPGGAIGTSKGKPELKEILRCKYYPQCTQKFYELSEYTSHARKTHADDEPFVCQQCKYTTESYDDIRRHLLAGIHCKICNCYLCPAQYSAEENLRLHMLCAHDEWREYQCPLCKKITDLADLIKHLGKHFPTPKKTECKRKVTYYFKCHLCPKEFLKNASFQKHLLCHKEIDEISHDCICCGEKFTELADFKKHSRMHFPITDENKCHICAKVLSRNTSLRAHIKKHFKIFRCRLCPREFAIKTSLDHHLLSCHKEVEVTRSHDCLFCDRRFSTRAMFESHLRVHLKTPLKCNQCSRQFKRVSDLKRHLLQRNGEIEAKSHRQRKESDPTQASKIFTCRMCSEDVLKSDLKRHLWRHKIFRCPHCPERYALETSLTKHLLSAHKKAGIIWYSCYCRKSFYTPSMLLAHLESHLLTQD